MIGIIHAVAELIWYGTSYKFRHA